MSGLRILQNQLASKPQSNLRFVARPDLATEFGPAFGWGGVWGHSWFTDPVKRLSVVSLTNTALEGMMGRYIRDLRDAIYADLV